MVEEANVFVGWSRLCLRSVLDVAAGVHLVVVEQRSSSNNILYENLRGISVKFKSYCIFSLVFLEIKFFKGITLKWRRYFLSQLIRKCAERNKFWIGENPESWFSKYHNFSSKNLKLGQKKNWFFQAKKKLLKIRIYWSENPRFFCFKSFKIISVKIPNSCYS